MTYAPVHFTDTANGAPACEGLEGDYCDFCHTTGHTLSECPNIDPEQYELATQGTHDRTAVTCLACRSVMEQEQ